MALSRLHSKLLPRLGKYAGHELPMTFNKFKTAEVVVNTRKPHFTTIFDVSHMHIYESSINNYDKLNKFLNLDLSKLKTNGAKLATVLNDDGVVLDDLLISNINDENFRLVVNTNSPYFDNDYLKMKNRSIIALQGDGSHKILEDILGVNLDKLYFMNNLIVEEDRFEICRCGYTGEDGFELYLDDKNAEYIYQKLVDLSLSKPESNVLFGGLIERDILRTEAGLNLSGTEFGEKLNIKFNSLNMPFLIDVKYRKNEQFKSNMTQMLFSSEKPISKGAVFKKDHIQERERAVGFITSSLKSFNLNKFIGIGYLNKDLININVNLESPKINEEIYYKDRKNKEYLLKCHKNFLPTKYYKKK